MDRLPFELLTHIANCLSLEPLPQLRQTSLSYLSRTNKTLLLATRPILYRDPVLSSDWRAKIYEKSVSKNVNPWLLSRSSKVDKQWWMPRSVCDALFHSEFTQRALKRTGLDSQLNFEYPEPPDACYDKWYGSPSGVDFVFSFGGLREIPSFDACRHEFIWSNLASIEISEYALDDGFLTGQFGPGRNSRKMLQSLFDPANPSAGYYPFLFDAIHFLDAGHLLRDFVKKGVDWPSNNDEEGLEDWERHEGGQLDKAAWEREEAGPNLVQKARFDYGVWQQYINLKALWQLDYDSLPALIHSRPPSPFPFSSLTNLSISCISPLDHFLIFYTTSFPALCELVIRGPLISEAEDELDWATARFSITRKKGHGIAYDVEDDSSAVFKPLSEKEMLEYPLQPYRSPDLRSLEIYS
ncbi:uncharacterized protein JCM6883_001409 [Sporobolomyces salmoneus]|uniref:uncharacterized protein n=1 Tax=Sporobolomyces salmoneus TaxID=183962 RepID=UPI00317FB31B